MTAKQNLVPMYINGLPKELKTRFKIWCANQGITMTRKIVELIKQALLESETYSTEGNS